MIVDGGDDRRGSVFERAVDRRAERRSAARCSTSAQLPRLSGQSSRLDHRGRRLVGVTGARRSAAERPATSHRRPRLRTAECLQLLSRGNCSFVTRSFKSAEANFGWSTDNLGW